MDDRRALDILQGAECPVFGCRETKRPKDALCKKHYCKLPQHLRRGLYLRLGKGFTQGLNRALQWLKENP